MTRKQKQFSEEQKEKLSASCMYLLLLAEELEVWPPFNAYFRRSFLSIRGELLVAHPKENASSASSSIMSVDCRTVTRVLSPTVSSQYVKP